MPVFSLLLNAMFFVYWALQLKETGTLSSWFYWEITFGNSINFHFLLAIEEKKIFLHNELQCSEAVECFQLD
jgi:hypothetical protein